MARKKTAKKKTARRKKPVERDDRNLKTLTIGLVMLGGSAAVAWLLWAGVGVLEQRASAHLTAGNATVQIVWPTNDRTAPPGERAERSWLPAMIRGELTDLAQAAADGDTNVLDRSQLRDVGRALMTTGWFDGEPTVERAADGNIVVSGKWRSPVCAVRSGDKDRLIAFDRKQLPPVYPIGRSGQHTVILGVSASPPMTDDGPSFESVWPGDDLDAALILLQALSADTRVYDEVAAIDVGDYARTGTLAIITPRDTRVVWGGRSDEFHPGELTTEAKLKQLQTLLDRYGGIDAGQQAIEIAWDRPLIIDAP